MKSRSLPGFKNHCGNPDFCRRFSNRFLNPPSVMNSPLLCKDSQRSGRAKLIQGFGLESPGAVTRRSVLMKVCTYIINEGGKIDGSLEGMTCMYPTPKTGYTICTSFGVLPVVALQSSVPTSFPENCVTIGEVHPSLHCTWYSITVCLTTVLRYCHRR